MPTLAGAGNGEDPTSKFPRKLARDILLSNDIGRDIAADPFDQRDITKIWGDPRRLDRGETVLCFANKPPRRTPTPTDMNRATGRNGSAPGNSASEAVIALRRRSQNATPDPGQYEVRLPDDKPQVSVPKAARWKDDQPQTNAQARKDVILRQHMLQLEADLQRCGTMPTPTGILSAPDPRRAPNFAGYAGRGQRGVANQQDVGASRIAEVDRFTVFPWEARNRELKKAVDLAGANASSSPRHAGAVVGTGRNGPASGPATQRSAATNGTAVDSTLFVDEEEVWQAERKKLIQRMGLGEGGSNHMRQEQVKKRQIGKGADFSSTCSRGTQPLYFMQRNPESATVDVMYAPSLKSSSKARAHSADVRISRYSGRDMVRTRQPFTNTVDKILTFENLVKFHQRQRAKAKASVFAMPDQDDDDDEQERHLSTLTKKDDFQLHPESALPPKRGLFQSGSPSLFFYSDRPGTSVNSTLSGAAAVQSLSIPRSMRKEATSELTAIRDSQRPPLPVTMSTSGGGGDSGAGDAM